MAKNTVSDDDILKTCVEPEYCIQAIREYGFQISTKEISRTPDWAHYVLFDSKAPKGEAKTTQGGNLLSLILNAIYLRQPKPKKIGTFDPIVRAAEKQASRDEDERQLESGEITKEELQKQNGFFSDLDIEHSEIKTRSVKIPITKEVNPVQLDVIDKIIDSVDLELVEPSKPKAKSRKTIKKEPSVVPPETGVEKPVLIPIDYLANMAYMEGKRAKKRSKPRVCFYKPENLIEAFNRGYDE